MGAASVMPWKNRRSYVLASENCAFDVVGAEFIRDIEPGEMVIIEGRLTSIKTKHNKPHRFCIFEHIYFARRQLY